MTFGRARRSYRVYAEEDFLDAEHPEHGDAGNPVDAAARPDGAGEPLDSPASLGGAPAYLAPRRPLPGTLGGRLAVALLALVAMALSALVVHALRVGLAGGAAAPLVSAAASPPALSHENSRGGSGAEADAPSVAPEVSSSRGNRRTRRRWSTSGRVGASRRDRNGRVEARRTLAVESVESGPGRVAAMQTPTAVPPVGAESEDAPPVGSTSEFGFEGQRG